MNITWDQLLSGIVVLLAGAIVFMLAYMRSKKNDNKLTDSEYFELISIISKTIETLVNMLFSKEELTLEEFKEKYLPEIKTQVETAIIKYFETKKEKMGHLFSHI